MKDFETLNWLVIAGYFVILGGVAIRVMTRRNKNPPDYFLAGRDLGWFVVGASILPQILARNT